MRINHRVLLRKDGLLAVMGIFKHEDDYFLTSWDVRMPVPSVQMDKDLEKSVGAFNEAVELSRDRGWSVIYYGQPNHG